MCIIGLFMEDGWDLDAVVRSCAASTTFSAAGSAAAESSSRAMDNLQDGFCRSMTIANERELVSFAETLSNYSSGGLDDVYKEGCGQSVTSATAATTTTAATSISFGGGRSSMFEDPVSFSITPVYSHHFHVKKRKYMKKRVVELREEELSNDGWSWRKYGQKPIKRSPHPRNYYRCSSVKDCLARKQVERSPRDTSKYIVSYYGNHLHPQPIHISSLADAARSTRFSTLEVVAASSSSPPFATSFSPTASLKEDETEMNDEDIDELIKNSISGGYNSI